MGRLDRFTCSQVGGLARQFLDAMVGAGRELQLAHGRAGQLIAGFVQFAESADLTDAHIRIPGR